MGIVNTFFKKDKNQLITYESGERGSQIDFLASRRNNIKEVRDCKVINGEDASAYHCLVLMKMKIKQEKRAKEKG